MALDKDYFKEARKERYATCPPLSMLPAGLPPPVPPFLSGTEKGNHEVLRHGGAGDGAG